MNVGTVKNPTSLRPWRSARLGWFVAGLFFAIGVPLFLRMPLWCDATLYQTAARNVMNGGVHYREIFDTNPPGFVWAICVVETIFGSSTEAIRFADLIVASSALIVLMRFASMAGAKRADLAWMAAGWASFYPYLAEFCHIQRDVWMMLPALLATWIRVRRVGILLNDNGKTWVFGSTVLEGCLWAVACWIKPHVVVPVFFVWLTTIVFIFRRVSTPVRHVIFDTVGVVFGAMIVFMSGLSWLLRTGTWDAYMDVNRNWNNGYIAIVFKELPGRIQFELIYFPPWSLFLLVAIPLSLVNVYRSLSKNSDWQTFVRGVLASLFLSWTFMAIVIQRSLDYVHVPEIVLMISVFAANRWCVSFLVIAIQVGLALLVVATAIPVMWSGSRIEGRQIVGPSGQIFNAHVALKPERTGHWFICWSAPSRETRRDVGFLTGEFGGLDPVELGAVADFLKSQNVKDRELIAWHDSPHALYTVLGIEPGIRFMHLSTMQAMGGWSEESSQYRRVRQEVALAIPTAKFVVSDLHRVTDRRGIALHNLGDDGLSRAIPDWQKRQFPMDLPILYRSPNGRYLVHQIRHPYVLGDCKIPEAMGDESEW